MIGIDMELPKGCASCPITDKICIAFALDKELKRGDLKISRHPNCPLVDLGKEDMSWEELKEKCKSFIKKIDKTAEGRNIEYFEIEPCGLSFWEDYIILDEHNDIVLTKQNYCQMYQIIKSLVGDER